VRAKRRMHCQKYLLMTTLFFSAAGIVASQSAPSNKERKEQKDDAAGFKEFSERVQSYIKLQKSVESSLPALKSTDLPEIIAAHQQALARKIREARPNAKRGDIFTDAAREAFRHAIRGEFEGSQADNARATMRQGAPLKTMMLRVNGIYPDTVPYTTVPPTLLAKFPILPDDVAYRVVGPDLVLIDVKSSIVVDLAHELIPPKP
jgi:hypothetical protein